MALATLVAISGPQKVSIFRVPPPPIKWPLLWICPPSQNHYVSHHIKNSYIISYNTASYAAPSDSFVPRDAGIEPRTVATGALTVRLSNNSARSLP